MTNRVRNSIYAVAIAVIAAALAACGPSDPTPTPAPRWTPSAPVQTPEDAWPRTEWPTPTAMMMMEPTPAAMHQGAPTTMPGPTTRPRATAFPAAPAAGGGGFLPPAAPALTATPAPAGEGFNSIGGSSTVNDEPYDLTFFKHYGVNPFIDTEDDRFSTFAVDVDTASYTVMRRFVRDGNLPDPASVRVEEYVNFFDQGYPPPTSETFAIHLEGSPSPFGSANHWLMRVGLQAKEVSDRDRKDATLIFAVDVSGSMGREDRLGLVKRSLRLLVNELRPRDEVGIVVYGDRGRVLLNPTDGGEGDAIARAIDSLQPGGSTYAEEGLRLAYDMAARAVRPGRITRVLLLSDGVGNVGATSADSILRNIRRQVESGVTLTTVGFGMGNYNDVLMERLANDGDGTYHYVDTLNEARRVFVENLVGTIQTVAKDAKVQVDFNPNIVSRYRLLGYENRRVADQDFRNDAVDAGEVGAGHNVTALYELKFHDNASGPVAAVYLRHQDPDTGRVTETSRLLRTVDFAGRFADASPRFQLSAVAAEYAELLRESYWAQDGSLERTAREADRVQRLIPFDADVAEFADLAARSARLR